MKTYVITDTAHLINRCMYNNNADIYTRTGLAINNIFGSLRKVYRDTNADHMIFAMEHKSWRYDVYPQYKAPRKLKALLASSEEKADNDIASEIISEFIEFLDKETNCTVLRKEGAEGDDWIGRLCQLLGSNNKIIINSGDSDFYCLITENISIYDGVNHRYIKHDGIYDTNGDKYEFTINSKAKLVVGKKNNAFTPEPYWWRKALFIKCIRGDSTDFIKSAYPNVRMTKIEKAWAAKQSNGFDYVNFMSQTAMQHDGTSATVMETYNFNKMLIDLTVLPEHINDMIDAEIALQLERPKVGQIGLRTSKYLKQQGLLAVLKDITSHVEYLTKSFL